MLALAWLLSGVNGPCPWAADASESAGHLLEVALGSFSAGLVEEWSILRCPMPPTSGLMVASFWIRSLVYLPLVLGFFALQSEH